MFFFFSSRRRHTRWTGDWSSDVCSSDLVPRALADAVHTGLDLARARCDGGQAVGDGEAEVVVAMDGDARLVDVRHVLLNLADEVAELLGNRVADRIRNVDSRRAGVDA